MNKTGLSEQKIDYTVEKSLMIKNYITMKIEMKCYTTKYNFELNLSIKVGGKTDLDMIMRFSFIYLKVIYLKRNGKKII